MQKTSMLRGLFDYFLTLSFIFYLSLFITDYSFILPAGGMSNIVCPTIVMIFLFSLRWIIDKKYFLECKTVKIILRLNNIPVKKLLFISAGFIFVSFSAVSIARHISLSSGTSDLGIFDQAVWSASRSGVLFSSLKLNINLLGDHFEPVLFLVAPLYKIWPNPIALLLLQSFLLSSSIFPLYLIARKRIKEKFIIYAIIIAYLVSRPLRGVAFSDFHPECFILPVLFWAYYFLISRKNLLFYLSLVFLLLCKEDTTFLIMGFGMFIILSKRSPLQGILLLIGGLSLWLLETKFIIPYFNHNEGYQYMNRLPLGLTYADNISSILSNPPLLFKVLFTPEKLEYALKLSAPLLFLSLLSPGNCALIIIPLLKNLYVSQNFSGFYNISSHYTAAVIPFVFISAVFGAGKLTDKLKNKKAVLSVGIFIILSSLLFFGKTDANQFSRFLGEIRNNHTLEKLSYLKIIPKEASVAANFNLVPHMSQRKYIYEWNPRSPTSYITEYVVIDMRLLEYLSKEDTAKIGRYLIDISDKGYRKIFENSDSTFLIFRNPYFDSGLVEKLT